LAKEGKIILRKQLVKKERLFEGNRWPRRKDYLKETVGKEGKIIWRKQLAKKERLFEGKSWQRRKDYFKETVGQERKIIWRKQLAKKERLFSRRPIAKSWAKSLSCWFRGADCPQNFLNPAKFVFLIQSARSMGQTKILQNTRKTFLLPLILVRYKKN
jgi:hypothetical protein